MPSKKTITDSMTNWNNLNESFSWQPNQIFIHKLVKSNDIVDERIMMLAHRGIITDPKNIYICILFYILIMNLLLHLLPVI